VSACMQVVRSLMSATEHAEPTVYAELRRKKPFGLVVDSESLYLIHHIRNSRRA
jgi:hypothetical protein